MFTRLLTITLLTFSILFVACSDNTNGIPITLRGAETPFSGESVMATIAGEPYRYFRYETVEEAVHDKKMISSDGKKIGGRNYLWEGPVHFYYYKDRLVIYVGDNSEVTQHIERTFGPQFAGD